MSVDKCNGIKLEDIDGRKALYGENLRKTMKHRSFIFFIYINWLYFKLDFTKSLYESFKNDFLIKLLLVSGIISIIVNTVSAENEEILKYSWIEGVALFVSAFIILMTNSVNDWKQYQQYELVETELNKQNEINVIRDSKICSLLSNEIVAGDLILLSEGMEIPADSYLIEGFDILMDESSMTGESDQIIKTSFEECLSIYNLRKSKNEKLGDHDIPSPLLISGTKVVSGEGKCIALAVGKSAAVNLFKDKTTSFNNISPLKMKLLTLALELSKIGLFLSSIVLTVFSLRFIIDRSTTDMWDHSVHWSEIVRFVIISVKSFSKLFNFYLKVVVLVVSVPEGLPITINIALSFSMDKMIKDNNLVRKIDVILLFFDQNNIIYQTGL